MTSRRVAEIEPFLAFEVAERAFQLERAGVDVVHLEFGEPTGAFYVLANARAFTRDSTRFALELLERAHVAVTPCAAFGPNAEGYLRFSYASSVERIEEGLRRIERFLATRR